MIDTPGMRTLHVSDAAAGIDELFAEITKLEPDCAVNAAVSNGTLRSERLARWRMMVTQNRSNTPKPVKSNGGKPIAIRHNKSHLETSRWRCI
ncbi:hypothetical protein BH10PSE11_BH10PSE11_06180 [soil metagenome]